MELRLAVWTLGLLIGQATLAQTPGSVLRFERLGPADGLSQSSVLALHQDRLGFLWLGTQDGLNRYDGTQVRVFRHDPLDPASMPTSYVQTIAETRDGALWLGTWGGGLSRLDPATETFTHFRHDPEDDSSLPDDVVTAILEDRAGRLWVGTGGGLARLDRATGRFRRTKGLPDPFVWSLAEAPDGALWVGFYRAGLARWNPTTGRARFYRHDPSRRDGLPSDETVTVRFAQGGTLWVGTGAGVARLDPTSGRATPVRPGAGGACGTLVYGLAEGTDGVLWVATGDGGLCRVEPATGRAEAFRHAPADPTSLPRDVVRAVFVDRTGVLWVGTDGGGAARFTGASERFGLVRAGGDPRRSLPHPHVWAIEEAPDGTLYVGTDGGGLARLPRGADAFTTYRHRAGDPSSLAADVVVAVRATRDGQVWAGTFGAGLSRLDPATGRFAQVPAAGGANTGPAGSVVTVLHEDPSGALWVGTWGNGLSRRDPATGRFRHFARGGAGSLPHDVVTALVEARGGGLWVGTYGAGVGRLDRASGRFQTFGAAPTGPLSHATVYAIHEDGAGALWIATAGGGLNRLDPATGTARVFTTRDGLPHNIVYGIVPDAAGRLWLSTNDGLAVFDPSAARVVRTYGVADGLQGAEFNSGAALRLRSGALAFGGPEGLNVFDPARVAEVRPPPPVVLTGLRRFDEPVRLTHAMPFVDEVRLSHRDNFVTVEFAALDFADPAGVRFRYRLDGVDATWRETDGRRPLASYTNLAGGRYTFRVQASHAGGAWSEPAVLAVRVIPPLWARGWTRALALAVLLALLAAAARTGQRRRAARRAQWMADQREAQRRLAEAREAERLRTARDIHDGPLQDLYGARYRLEALEGTLAGRGDGAPDSAADPLAQAAAVRATLLDASRRLRDVCAELRPPVLGAVGLARALQAAAERAAEGHPVQVTVEADDGADDLPETVRVALYRVAQEALRNALRHAEARAVTLRLDRTPDAVQLRVSDDGRGFVVPRHLAELAREDHLGLLGAAERVEAVGGTLGVTSAPGSGTTVVASVPLSAPPADLAPRAPVFPPARPAPP